MENEYRRGECYWVLVGDGIGREEQVRRPGVIVSSDKGNETSPLAMIAYITSQRKYGSINIAVSSLAKPSTVMCNQVYCIDKCRLGAYITTLSEDEMANVDRGLRIALGLNPSVDDEDDADDEEDAEVSDTTIRLAVERDMWKKMYERVLEELVSVKCESDAKRVVEINTCTEEKPVKPVKEVAVKFEPEPKLVEINTCTEEELRNAGVSLSLIKHIIANRPYKSVEDLRVIPTMTRIAYQIMAPKMRCVPVAAPKKPSKVNVNTATVEEMVAVAGLPKLTAQNIRAWRNKNGKFVSVEDLMNVPRFGKICLKRYGPLLEV